MLSRYWKAGLALLAIVATGLGSVAADPSINDAVPGASAWVTAAGAIIGTALVWGKRNETTVQEAEEILRRAKAREAGEKPV